MQNELIKLMTLHVQQKIAANLQSTEFIAVMVDECTDVHNQEQVKNYYVYFSVCYLWDIIGSCCFTMGG